jgi:hypothetical protein
VDDVRVAAAEDRLRVVEWRESPWWRDDPGNRDRYDLTVRAVDVLDELPQSADAAALAETVRPITDAWRPNRAGPEQAIYAAVDRLRDAVRRLSE